MCIEKQTIICVLSIHWTHDKKLLQYQTCYYNVIMMGGYSKYLVLVECVSRTFLDYGI